MNNSFYYQLLTGFSLKGNRLNLSRYFKEMAKKGDIDNVGELLEKIKEEIDHAGARERDGEEYFLFMAEQGLLFTLYRGDFQEFDKIYESVERGMLLLKKVATGAIDLGQWENYFIYLTKAASRLKRNSNIEAFEAAIDEIEWDEFGKDFIYRLSGITGFVYLNETGAEKFNKSRFWLERAIADTNIENGLHLHLNLLDFHFRNRNQQSRSQIESRIKEIETQAASVQDPQFGQVLKAAILDQKARALIFKFTMYDDDTVKIEENLGFIRDIENNVDYEGKDAPSFLRGFLKTEFAKYYQKLTLANLDKEDKEDLLALALENVKAAQAYARKAGDEALLRQTRMIWLSISNHELASAPEKDLKEVYNNIRKSDNLRDVLFVTREYATYFVNNGNTLKAYEILLDLLKNGVKSPESGNFYLAVNGFRLINTILIEEVETPGVSWVVAEGAKFFERIQEIVDNLEAWNEYVGREQFDLFRLEYNRFEPASHVNILVYYRYQWYGIKLMRVSAVYAGDEIAVKLADKLLGELENESNPMTFIQGNWEEFKDVPNSVRNKTINKCITITKGDLPAAAEHLDFSYRNLRSYITFKEVNRLGNFLEERKTNNRQLEYGIRLMFHDLYKNGTIFEVVFDMPKFLVEFANSGFSSQDLEEALSIKGTTAKKYIKIMMEIGMIKHEKSVGRKHFYKLRRDNVMNRLGKDAAVLVG